ncbi:hypothetical protein COHA_009583 [Chlorella ohadii]|uniref:Hyaluronan/mRNA-binding protein domain-containing protein n=1 Tax=Chlorella ohadii TaxID=2649997 RepID=A0AAD5DI18_9CHLO|nr:hypothetical protein COHA_009583 [Chlorella ohadii]
MDAPISPKGISKDAQRHVGDYVHHVEKAKEMRLDRQDGTGRAHEFKKNGAGKGNWGSLEDDVTVGEEEVEEEGPAAVSPRDFVDDEKVMTLDEFEARQAAEKA